MTVATRPATGDTAVPPPVDPSLRDPANVTSRPVASVGLLAAVVPALFARLFFAGRAAASDAARPARVRRLVGCSSSTGTAKTSATVLKEHPTRSARGLVGSHAGLPFLPSDLRAVAVRQPLDRWADHPAVPAGDRRDGGGRPPRPASMAARPGARGAAALVGMVCDPLARLQLRPGDLPRILHRCDGPGGGVDGRGRDAGLAGRVARRWLAQPPAARDDPRDGGLAGRPRLALPRVGPLAPSWSS
jgi:hypothetical protein